MIVTEQEYLTPDEIALRLRVKRETVMQWLRLRKMRGYKVGSLWRVTEEDYQQFLRSGYNADLPQRED